MAPSLILDAAFVLIAIIFIAVGIKRGFIKSLIQSAKFVLAILVTSIVAPMVSVFVKEKFIYQPIFDWLNKVGTSAVETLPKFLQPAEGIIGQEVAPIADSISGVISNIIAYLVTFVLALIVLTIVAWLLTKLAEKFSLLGAANRLLGGVFGAVMGAIVLCVVAGIIKFIDAEQIVYPDTVIVQFLGNLIQ